MHITQHALFKFEIGRTKMDAKGIVEILEAGLGISLGTSSGVRYMYFFSGKDVGGRIALINLAESVLISIWLPEYVLPAGVRTPTDKDLVSARAKIKRWLETTSLANQRKKEAQDPDAEGTLTLSVYEGKKLEFEKEYNTQFKQVSNRKRLIRFLRDDLTVIAKAIGEHQSVRLCTTFRIGDNKAHDCVITTDQLRKYNCF